MVERPPRAAATALLSWKVSGDVPVVLQFVQIASDGAASELATECSHQVRSREASAVRGERDDDGELDAIHAHPDQPV